MYQCYTLTMTKGTFVVFTRHALNILINHVIGTKCMEGCHEILHMHLACQSVHNVLKTDAHDERTLMILDTDAHDEWTLITVNIDAHEY